jgi:hypothetical protein
MITQTTSQEGIIDGIKPITSAQGHFDHTAIEGIISACKAIVTVQPHDPSDNGSVDCSRSAGEHRLRMTIVLPSYSTATAVIVDL